MDLHFDEDQRAIAEAVASFCRDRVSAERVKAASGGFPAECWRELAELGFLAIGTPEGGGGPVEIVAMVEQLGRVVFPGPIAETLLATQLLPTEQRVAVAEGRTIVSTGVPPLMPWAAEAGLFLVLDRGTVHRARAIGEVSATDTLGGEPWGRVQLERGEAFENAQHALVLYDVVLASYLSAAAQGLLESTAEHARGRKQFGRPIGSFQAVAHPLANCHMDLGAASTLARAAASQLACGKVDDARGLAAAARISSRRAALETAHACHQALGAIGITLEGPAHHVTRRIRQLATAPPAPEQTDELLLEHLGVDQPYSFEAH